MFLFGLLEGSTPEPSSPYTGQIHLQIQGAGVMGRVGVAAWQPRGTSGSRGLAVAALLLGTDALEQRET